MGFDVYGGGWWDGDSIRRFAAYCQDCQMVFKNNSGYQPGDTCPQCHQCELEDPDIVQDVWDEFDSGRINGAEPDEEGNLDYPDDD